MRYRCQDVTNPDYRYYGARGITVCDQWSDFLTFVHDMGERPDGHTLDRIDSDGNYEPSNCRWATRSQQNTNRTMATARSIRTTKPPGIKLKDGKYRFRASYRGKTVYHSYDTLEEAELARSDYLFEREMHNKLGL